MIVLWFDMATVAILYSCPNCLWMREWCVDGDRCKTCNAEVSLQSITYRCSMCANVISHETSLKCGGKCQMCLSEPRGKCSGCQTTEVYQSYLNTSNGRCYECVTFGDPPEGGRKVLWCLTCKTERKYTRMGAYMFYHQEYKCRKCRDKEFRACKEV